MSRFIKSKLLSLTPYTPGEQTNDKEVIKLNTNESPFPPSPKVMEAISGSEIEKLRLYSDPEAKELVYAASEFYKLTPNQIIAGNGSDEILAFVFMAYGEKICFPEISYGFYKVYANLFSDNALKIPLDKNLKIIPEDYFDKKSTILICNPNAPTGIALNREEIIRILNNNKENLIIIDEAYVDFGAESMVPLIDQYDNLLVIQTFSKSRSLAGSRIGLALGNKYLIEDLNRIKYSFNPYNMNRLSIITGVSSLKDKEYFYECCKEIIKTRDDFVLKLEKQGFVVLESKANFVFAKPPFINAKEYQKKLRENNILVRHFNDPLISNYVRITIGKKSDMEKIISLNENVEWFKKDEV